MPRAIEKQAGSHSDMDVEVEGIQKWKRFYLGCGGACYWRYEPLSGCNRMPKLGMGSTLQCR